MSTYVDTDGREWHGNASAADVEAFAAWQRRERLGAAIRARREALGLSLRQTARSVGRSHAWLSRLETGIERPGEDSLVRLALRLGCTPAEQTEWTALAGIVPQPLLAALLAQPARWDDVLARLDGTVPW